MDLRDRVGTATVLIQERKESIANLGERLGAAENQLATLREKRARSEGRDEVEDTKARQLGKAGIGLGGGAAIWQLIQYVQQLLGG
jgi:hypothetical protein